MSLAPLHIWGRLVNLLKDQAAHQWKSWEANSGSWAPEPTLFSVVLGNTHHVSRRSPSRWLPSHRMGWVSVGSYAKVCLGGGVD